MKYLEDVLKVLEQIPDVSVYYIYPQTWPKGSVITYQEVSDNPDKAADDRTYTRESRIKVDVFCDTPGKAKSLGDNARDTLVDFGWLEDSRTGAYKDDMSKKFKDTLYFKLIF